MSAVAHRRRFSTVLALAAGAGAGAALMFLLDPARGAVRRSRLRDQSAHLFRRGRRFAEAAAIDLANRGRGAAIRATGLGSTEPASDDVLVARIRSAIGRIVTHPGSVHVMIDNGVIRLDGPILSREVQPVLRTIRRIAGDRPIDNGLVVPAQSEQVPGLQGQGMRPRHPFRHQLRSPGIRVLLGATASGIAAVAMAQLMKSRQTKKVPELGLPA